VHPRPSPISEEFSSTIPIPYGCLNDKRGWRNVEWLQKCFPEERISENLPMSISISKFAITVALTSLLTSGPSAEAADKTRAGLLELIQNGKSKGLTDADVRQSALKAGWDRRTVDMALSISDYKNTAAPRDGGARQAIPDGFRIGAGDVLQIIVWKEIDASVPETVVRADGMISLPFVKEVEVAGLTPAEAEEMLSKKLYRFIKDADVTVVTKQINSKKIYLIGAVRREGAIPIRSSMTVLQAIIEAGGLNEYAKQRKIYILRKQDGKQVRLPFDYAAVIKGEHVEQNIVVQPDDSIVIPH
jgi:polysaccharide biosynthesis/export protein